MTGHRGYLREFKETAPAGSFVTFGNNMKGEVKGHGNISNANFTIKKVAYVDGLKHNLISIAHLYDNDYKVLFTKNNILIMDSSENILVDSQREWNMYPLEGIEKLHSGSGTGFSFGMLIGRERVSFFMMLIYDDVFYRSYD